MTDQAAAGQPDAWQISLLGAFRVRCGGATIPAAAWKRRAAKTLFKLLALRPGHSLHAEEAIELLWPEASAADGRNNLDRTVYYLRQTLKAHLPAGHGQAVLLREGMIRLDPPVPLLVDALLFEEYLRRAGAAEQPVPWLERALELYQGPLLAEDRNEEWVFEPRERLARARAQALHQLAAACQAAGDAARQIAALHLALEENPTDEPAHRGLIAAYAAAGRRAEALAQYRRCQASLAGELGLEPEAETRELYRRILAGEWSRAPAPGDPAVSAPRRPPAEVRPSAPPRPRNSFIGRDGELAGLCDQLRRPEVALLTLWGPPGVGKTRLALECAERLGADFPDGVFWVALGSISQPEHVVPAIMQVVGNPLGAASPGGRTHAPALAGRRMLLMLDNAEHVLAAAPALAALLRANPLLKILVTSRALLQISGEQVLAVPPLAPRPGAGRLAGGADPAEDPAVRLFAARARAVQPDFQLTPATLPLIATICRRLDGLPLAIELAAARMRALTPGQLLERLERRFQLLTSSARDVPARQQTLRAAVDWSYAALSPAEQAVFARLGVFAGGCGLEAIEAVCPPPGDGSDLLDALESLVDQSMLQRALPADGLPGGESRFLLLETLREYALERLGDGAEAWLARQAHAAYYLDLAERAERSAGREQPAWLDRLERNHENARVALRWALAAGGETAGLALRLAGALAPFWQVRGYWREGFGWLRQALAAEREAGDAAGADARIKALLAAGRLGALVQEHDAAGDCFAAARERAAALGDELAETHARAGLATLWVNRHQRPAEARRVLEECLASYQRLGDGQHLAETSVLLMRLARHTGQQARAGELIQRSLGAARASGSRVLLAEMLHNLAHLAFAQGRAAEARELFAESLALERELGNPAGVAQALAALGLAWLHAGDHARAEPLFAESLALRESISDRWAVALSYDDLARAALSAGDCERARKLFRQSIELLAPMGEELTISYRLDGLAWVDSLCGEAERGARLAGAADQARARHGKIVPPMYAPDYQATLERLRAALAPEGFAAAWRAGQALGFDLAVRYACGYPEALLGFADPAPPPG